MTELITLNFQDTTFSIVDHNGERWVTVKQLAAALGYSDYRQLHKLIKRNDQEFSNKIAVVNLTTVENQSVTIINYHGVIRAAMLSNAPRAIEFRDWAETVLFEVMTQGHYVHPGAEHAALDKLLADLSPLLEAQTLALAKQAEVSAYHEKMMTVILERIANVETRFSQTYIPTNQDNSFWPTPTERLRVLVDNSLLPPYFNRGGSWDVFAAQRHAHVKGGLLSQRNRNNRGKMPDYVIQPCPLNDKFLIETLEVWKRERGEKQGCLQLTIKKGETNGR